MSDALSLMIGGVDALANFNPSTFVMNGSTDQMEFIFQAKEAMTITRVGMLFSAKTGTATTWKMSLQTPALGVPDGTILGGGSPASFTFTNSEVTAGTFFWKNLDNTLAVTGGQELALVLAYDSGTTPSAGVNDLTVSYASNWITATNFAYAITNDAGSRTRSVAGPFTWGYGPAGVAYGNPAKAAYAATYNSGSSPNEYGTKFTVPSWFGDTCSLIGASWVLSPPSTTVDNTMIMTLYDGTTALQTVTKQMANSASMAQRHYGPIYFDESSLTTLTAGNTYRVALAPQTANNSSVRGWTVDDAANFAPWPLGDTCCVSHRSGGAWTDVTTSRFFGNLMFKDVTKTGGGGTVVIPTFSGLTGVHNF